MDAELFKKVISEAIDGEIEAQKFYKDVSEQIRDASLKELFHEFYTEEKKHEAILTGLLAKGAIHKSVFGSPDTYNVAETIDLPEVSPDMSLKDAIGLAMKNEEIAMKKYQALADNSDDPGLKSVFSSLADMEKGHKAKMETAFVDVAYPEVW